MSDTPASRDDRIRERAYGFFRWRQLTSHDGTPIEDWLLAESYINAEDRNATPTSIPDDDDRDKPAPVPAEDPDA